ncbi:MAG TPA: ABC transporter ATP-binding protein [Jatrophihabitantaceae bacterium]|nr:ABC transporter ATP-binding protein [Jatrophihabitantaceae bacterium]
MSPVLVVEELTKRFAGITALDRVSIQIDEGERVGLIGPNGAGKTTFFNCMLGVLPVDDGTVELAGRDISRLRVSQRARLGIGRTFQRIELFPDSTVRDHLFIAERVRSGRGRLWKDLVGLGRPRADELAACDEVLELLGLRDLADEPIERLSLGQCRLVEVGRALMTQPKVLMLDEPSSGLDRAETAKLAKTLQEVQAAQRFAILLVEHDVELVASFTTRCYALDYGRLITEGTSKDVLASPEVRAAYLGDMEPAQ